MNVQFVRKTAWAILLLFSTAACRKNKVKCTGNSEKTFTAANFNKVRAGSNFNVYITQGAAYSVKAKGCTESINDLEVTVRADNELKIDYRQNNRQQYETIDIIITMPQLLNLYAFSAVNASINGMANQPLAMRIVLSGASECVVNGAAAEMLFDLHGASKLEITGSANVFTGDLNGASHLRAYGLAAKETDVTASRTSEAYVTARDKLYAEASGSSIIRYKGNPPLIFTNTSGTSRIIKE